VTIGNDGTVSVVLPGQALPSTVGQLQLAGFVNPAGLEPKGQNIFGETAASGTPNVGTPGRTASASSSRASSRPRTSTWSRSSCR
jgi:flagellar basal-body rod protein FlgG